MPEIINLGKKVGTGSEGSCYEILDDDGQITANILKISNWFGKIWQTQNPEYIEKCLRAYQKHDIDHVETIVHRDVLVEFQGGVRKEIAFALQMPFIENFDDKKLDFFDLIEPIMGPVHLRTLVRYVKAADKIFREEDAGLDMLGGEIMIDALSGFFQRYIKDLGTVRGNVHNLIVEQGKLVLTDIGMHDLSPDGKFKFVTRNTNYMAIATVIKMIRIANEQLSIERQLSPEELENIPYNGPEYMLKIAENTWHRMLPLLLKNNAVSIAVKELVPVTQNT